MGILGFLAVLWTSPALAQQPLPPEVDQAKVESAIQKGVAFLRTTIPNIRSTTQAGRTVYRWDLVLWTFIHAGIPESDPDFQKLFKDMLERNLETTYNVSLQAMILEELDRVNHQRRIWQCAQFLVDNQCQNGQWSYGDPTAFADDVPSTAPARKSVATGGGDVKDGKTIAPLPPGVRVKPPVKNRLKVEKKRDGPSTGDNSNSQYAALGMRACHDAGILLPPAVADRAIACFRSLQKPSEGPAIRLEMKDGADGGKGRSSVMEAFAAAPQGWCYDSKEDHKPYGTMTAGVAGSLAIWLYVKDNDAGKRKSWRRDLDVLEGVAWLARNFSVTFEPGLNEHSKEENGQSWYYFYYLYALERMGLLYGTEWIGTHKWYPEGAKVLVETQNEDGSWGKDATFYNACFAVLFLKRATRPLDVASVDNTHRK